MRTSGKASCKERPQDNPVAHLSEKNTRINTRIQFRQMRKGICCGLTLLILSMCSSISKETPIVRLSEFMASNVTIFPDNVDFDDYSDWIELENTSNAAINLRGYFLTDDLKMPLKWAFPSGAIIPANGYLTMLADGFHANPGDDAIRAFSPWDDFTVQRLHTNFKLDANGESIGLFTLNGLINSVPLIPMDAVWKYHDLGMDLGDTTWFTPSFDDASWESGPAPLGYGDDDLATTLDFGNSSNRKHPTYYLRHNFHVKKSEGTEQTTLRFSVDDGAILYLNGIEIHRTRMPQGPSDYDTFASQTASEGVFESITLGAESLLEGRNVIAVEVHQSSRNSSDVNWELEMWTEQTLGDPVLVDSVIFTQQYPDVSYGRTGDSGDQWSYFG